MNQIFDINRAWHYFKLKTVLNKRMLFISLAGFLGFVFIITFFIANSIHPGQEYYLNNFHIGAYLFMLFVGGVFITGRSFHDMNTSEKSIAQLMIPASVFEKFITPFLISTIGWIALSLVSYEVFAILTNGLWGATFGFSPGIFNIFDYTYQAQYFDILKSFFLIHSIFFLGATAYKKYPIGKTALSIFIFNSIFSFFTLFMVLILFGSFTDFSIASANIAVEVFYEGLVLKLQFIAEWLFIIIIPLILYIIAFYKLKEREV